MISRILRRMLYLFRLHRIITITLEEYSSVSSEDKRKPETYYNFPKQYKIYDRFKVLRKKKRAKIFSYVLAIGEADGYIKLHEYPTLNGMSMVDIPSTVAVTKKGVKFITPGVFINTLIGAISPAMTIVVSVLALVVSILVAIYK